MADDIRVTGLDDVLAKLSSVKGSIARSGLRSAGVAAMSIVRDAARAKARQFDDPESPASVIWRKIVTRYDARGSKRVGGLLVKVGVMGGAVAKPGRNDTGHWRHKEFGTEKTRATPFMRLALQGNAQRVVDKFVAEIGPRIDKALARAAKRAAKKAGG